MQESRWLYAVGLVASALSAGYAAKIVVTVWRPVPATERSPTQAHHDEEQQGTRHVGALEQAPLVLLAMGALTLGVLAVPPLGDTLARAVGDVPRHTALLELAVSAVIALAVLAWEWRHPRVPEPRWALGWLGLERAAHAGAVRPTLWVSARLAHFDDQVLDRAITRLASGTLTAARRIARFDDAVLDGSVQRISRASLRAADRSAGADDRWLDATIERSAGWIRGLGRLARRPQTGQLHQYYLQAVAVLAIGVLLLLTVR